MSLLKSSDQASRDTFERWSGFYDRSEFINNYLNRWDQEIIALAPPSPLLDIGCGPGRLVNKLLESGYNDICGIDLTKQGLFLAREKSLKSAADSLHLTKGMAEKLPFKGEVFKSVVISGALHHLEKPKPVLAEAARVLDNSGLLIVAEPYFPPLMRHFINAVLSIYPITGDRRFYAPSKIEELATNAGFEKINVLKMPLAYILVFRKCYS